MIYHIYFCWTCDLEGLRQKSQNFGVQPRAYCDEVVHFFNILNDRYVSDQIMNIADDEAQSLYHVQLNNDNVIMEVFFKRQGHILECPGVGIYFFEGGSGGVPEVTGNMHFYIKNMGNMHFYIKKIP